MTKSPAHLILRQISEVPLVTDRAQQYLHRDFNAARHDCVNEDTNCVLLLCLVLDSLLRAIAHSDRLPASNCCRSCRMPPPRMELNCVGGPKSMGVRVGGSAAGVSCRSPDLS
jgi:hypothetical protein